MSRWSPAIETGAREPQFFGFRVRPITLGHLRLMRELGVDAWSEDPAEAMFAACLCSQPHSVSRRDSLRWWFAPLMEWRARKLGASLAVTAEHIRWNEWVSFQLSGPSQKFRGTPGGKPARGSLAAPMDINLTACLMGCLGMTEESAESMPVRRARQLLAAYHEASGSVELWTDKEYAFEEACKRADARKAAARQTTMQN